MEGICERQNVFDYIGKDFVVPLALHRVAWYDPLPKSLSLGYPAPGNARVSAHYCLETRQATLVFFSHSYVRISLEFAINRVVLRHSLRL